MLYNEDECVDEVFPSKLKMSHFLMVDVLFEHSALMVDHSAMMVDLVFEHFAMMVDLLFEHPAMMVG